jgi:hypothetical protein
MTDFSFTLFDEVFIKVDDGPNSVCQLPDTFKYEGKGFDHIKKNFKKYDLEQLKDILYLYKIKMHFADHRDKKCTVPYFKHKEDVDTVLEYIDNAVDDLESESE